MASSFVNDLRRDRIVYRFLAVSIAVSLPVCVVAAFYFSGVPEFPPSDEHVTAASSEVVTEIGEFRSFLQKSNWWPYPVFFLVIGIVAHLSWTPFQDAWRRGAKRDRPIIVSDEGRPMSSDQLKAITDRLERIRAAAFGVALLIGLLWTVGLDSPDPFRAHTASSYGAQIVPALPDPDFFYRWLFEVDPTTQQAPLPAPLGQILLTILLFLMQSALIALGFLVLFQCVIQVVAVNNLQILGLNEKSLSVKLDHRDPVQSFGLGDWNAALDNLYWMIALGLAVPILSMLNQPDAERDLPQVVGIYVLGLLVAFPFVATVFGRRQWLHRCRRQLERKGSDEDWEMFNKQRLWPMDARRLGKVGIAVCLGMYGLFAGVVTADFLRQIMG